MKNTVETKMTFLWQATCILILSCCLTFASLVDADQIKGSYKPRKSIDHERAADYLLRKSTQRSSNQDTAKRSESKKSYLNSYYYSPSPYIYSYQPSYGDTASATENSYSYPAPAPYAYLSNTPVGSPSTGRFSSYTGYSAQSSQVHCSSYSAPPAMNRSEKFEVKGRFFKSIGCWRDQTERAIERLEGKHRLLKDLDYRSRVNALMKCAEAAIDTNLTMFALQNGGQCFGGKNAEGSYRKYGPSTACCGDGEGGPWSNEVYSFLDNQGQPYVNAKYSPWSAWSPCSQTCNNGSNNPVQMRNRSCYTIQFENGSPMQGCSVSGPTTQTRPCVLQICLGNPGTNPQLAPGTTIRPLVPPGNGPSLPPSSQLPGIPQGMQPFPTARPSSTSYTIGPPAFAPSSVCRAKVDLGFLIDGSSSIEKTAKGNFKRELNFVKKIIDGFEVSRYGAHVGVIIFSSDARVVSGFDEHYDKSEILNVIDNIRYPNGGTYIGKALNRARKALFSRSHRHGILSMLIVITDGQSQDSVTESAQRLRDSGVTIFAVGLGSGYDIGQLRIMATDPDSQHVYKADFNNVGSVIQSIRDRTCLGSGGATQAPPTVSARLALLPRVCKAKVDLAILIDGSQSIEYFAKGNFRRCLEFVKKLLMGFNIARDGTHAGVVVYSNNAQVVFGFERYLSLQPMLYAVDRIKYPQSSTYTGRALDVVRTRLFEASARQGVPNILLVMTDGASQDDVEEPSRRLRNMGVTVFTLGIGKSFDVNQLNTMATDPDRDHVFTCDFSQLGGGGRLLPWQGYGKGTVRSAEYANLASSGIPRAGFTGAKISSAISAAREAEEAGLKVKWKPNGEPDPRRKESNTVNGGYLGMLGYSRNSSGEFVKPGNGIIDRRIGDGRKPESTGYIVEGRNPGLLGGGNRNLSYEYKMVGLGYNRLGGKLQTSGMKGAHAGRISRKGVGPKSTMKDGAALIPILRRMPMRDANSFFNPNTAQKRLNLSIHNAEGNQSLQGFPLQKDEPNNDMNEDSTNASNLNRHEQLQEQDLNTSTIHFLSNVKGKTELIRNPYVSTKVASMGVYKSSSLKDNSSLKIGNNEYRQPIALFPLNAKYKAMDVIGGNLPGDTENVIPAAGPYNESNNSLSFLGAPDSFIEFPNNGKLDTKDSMTLLAWILPETAGPIFNYMVDDWGVNFWMARPRKLFARFVDRENEKLVPAVKSTHIKPGKWNFVGATYNQKTGQAGLWINGKLEDWQDVGNISLATNYPVRMGARIGDKRYYRGRISCMQVYNVALNWREISAAKLKCRTHPKVSLSSKKSESLNPHAIVVWD